MRQYYVTPPILLDMPNFLKKRFVVAFIRKLIQWSNNEYNTGYRYLAQHASPRTIKFFQEEYSAFRVLAEYHGFKEMIGLLDEANFSRLLPRERRFIRQAYQLHQSLS